MENIKEFLKRSAQPDLTWQAEAKARQKNEPWLMLSFEIALVVLATLKEKNITQRELAEMLECSPQYISKILKGSENLTLETICKLESALNIKLISSTFSQQHLPG